MVITSCNHSSAKLCGSCMQENSRLEYVEYLRNEIAQRDERIKELEQALREVADKGDGWSKSIAEEALSRT